MSKRPPSQDPRERSGTSVTVAAAERSARRVPLAERLLALREHVRLLDKQVKTLKRSGRTEQMRVVLAHRANAVATSWLIADQIAAGRLY